MRMYCIIGMKALCCDPKVRLESNGRDPTLIALKYTLRHIPLTHLF